MCGCDWRCRGGGGGGGVLVYLTAENSIPNFHMANIFNDISIKISNLKIIYFQNYAIPQRFYFSMLKYKTCVKLTATLSWSTLLAAAIMVPFI